MDNLHEKHVYNNIWFAGFTTASRGCCGIGSGGQVAGIIPCVPTSSLCSDREKHVFWDQYHPSEAANVILAKQLINGDKRYISPINLRQLIDLWSYTNSFPSLNCQKYASSHVFSLQCNLNFNFNVLVISESRHVGKYKLLKSILT